MVKLKSLAMVFVLSDNISRRRFRGVYILFRSLGTAPGDGYFAINLLRFYELKPGSWGVIPSAKCLIITLMKILQG